MRTVRSDSSRGWLCIVLAVGSCGTRQVEIIGALPDGAVLPTPCPASLAERLSVVEIPVGQNIAWEKQGYDLFPADERVALAVQPDGQAQLAWMEVNPVTVAGGDLAPPIGVHVTPLDASLARRGPDALLPNDLEVSGLVAHDDGFALLTRDLDPGSAIDLGDGATVAFLVRYQNGAVAYDVPLTGSLAGDAAESATLYSPFLEGQLVWSGSTYGAYFAVRGGQGDPQSGLWRDALVFREADLLPARWPMVHGCENNGGIRLIPDPGKVNLLSATLPTIPEMTGLCVQQVRPELKLTSLEADRVISDQEVGVSGYSGARLGSLLKITDGYLMFWLSLGATNDHQGHDIRMARLDSSFNLIAGPTWLARTPGIEEWNLHVAPYGPDGTQFLMAYGEIAITGVTDSDYAVYVGNYLGTHLTLIDANGTVLLDEPQPVPGAPTTANDQPVVLPGGDVAWAFVNPSPDYTQIVPGPNGPGQTTLRIARVRYCQ